jgi:hypothetical protein
MASRLVHVAYDAHTCTCRYATTARVPDYYIIRYAMCHLSNITAQQCAASLAHTQASSAEALPAAVAPGSPVHSQPGSMPASPHAAAAAAPLPPAQSLHCVCKLLSQLIRQAHRVHQPIQPRLNRRQGSARGLFRQRNEGRCSNRNAC